MPKKTTVIKFKGKRSRQKSGNFATFLEPKGHN